MGILDDLRSSIAKTLASQAAERATRSFEQRVESLADDFATAAEKELEGRRAERADRLEALEAAASSAREDRSARKAAAADELARLKAAAARDTRTDAGEPEADPRSREL